MTTSTANSSIAAQNESRLIIPQLASFYEYTPGLSWLIVRLTAGGMLLVHGIMKAMPMAEKGLAATLEAFAANVLARRGIEPALPLAYVVFFLETIGAVCVMLGLFTRFFAAALRTAMRSPSTPRSRHRRSIRRSTSSLPRASCSRSPMAA